MPPFSDQPDAQAPAATGATATLACPDCHTTLQTAANQAVEAPCPVCGRPLRYDPPTRAKLAHFQPLRHRPRRPAPEGSGSPRQRHSPRGSLRGRLHQANEFLNSRKGMLAACGTLCLLLMMCVHLFCKWDARRRAQALRDRTPPPAERVRPTEPNPVVPVVLPADPVADPDPDPFALSPDQIIEVDQPKR